MATETDPIKAVAELVRADSVLRFPSLSRVVPTGHPDVPGRREPDVDSDKLMWLLFERGLYPPLRKMLDNRIRVRLYGIRTEYFGATPREALAAALLAAVTEEA